MHNCKQIKDWILTDYVDGQLDAVQKAQVDEHLGHCLSCQELAKEVKLNLVTPLEQSSRMQVPEDVWHQISRKIQAPKEVKESVADRIARWLSDIPLPRLIPALGSFVVIVFLATSVLLDQVSKQQTQEKSATEVAEVLMLTSVSTQMDSLSGTPIERYFL